MNRAANFGTLPCVRDSFVVRPEVGFGRSKVAGMVSVPHTLVEARLGQGNDPR